MADLKALKEFYHNMSGLDISEEDFNKCPEVFETLKNKLSEKLASYDRSEYGTNLTQDKYKEITVEIPNSVSDDDAKDFLAKELGFSKEKLGILHQAKTFENKYFYFGFSEKEAFDRLPRIKDRWHNYIAFTATDEAYECINGHLYEYYGVIADNYINGVTDSGGTDKDSDSNTKGDSSDTSK